MKSSKATIITAPVILFVFNRLDHTRATLQSLQKNVLANQTDLYIFSDAPRKNIDGEAEKVLAVRKYIRSIEGFRSITIYEQPHNIGLAGSIIAGVNRITQKHGRVIVLEDDLITSPHFLTFMNSGLDLYEDEKKVMSINGYKYPTYQDNNKNTYLFRLTSSWGWATWADRWKHFEVDTKLLHDTILKNDLRHYLNIDGSHDFFSHLIWNLEGVTKTWAIKWYASIVINNGLTLFPGKSLVMNIGNDNSGTHIGASGKFAPKSLAKSIRLDKKVKIEEDEEFLQEMKFFFTTQNPTSQKHRIDKFITQLKEKLHIIRSLFKRIVRAN